MIDTFKQIISDLNQEQKDIVESGSNLYVTACPGSGKTRVLTRKIAYQTLKYPDSIKRIVAITYTNRASDEIKERLDLLGIDNSNIWVGTIHQFCLEFIVYPFKMNVPIISKGFAIIDEYTQRDYIKQIADTLNLKLGYYEINKIDLSLSTEFEINEISHPEVSEMYHDMLKENKEIDFDMILLMAYKILSENNNVARIIANNIRAIYVDEFQDTRELQYDIIAKLIKNNPNIKTMFVGDIDQAIYGSLGGVAKSVEELEILTELKFHKMTLHGCYRSTQRLVNFYSNFQGIAYSIESRGENKDNKGIIKYDCKVTKKKLPNIIKDIIEEKISNGITEKDICIIAPQHHLLISLGNQLKKTLPSCNFDAISIYPIKVNNHSMFFKLAALYFTEPGKKIYRRKAIAKDILKILSNEFMFVIEPDFISLDLLNLINGFKRLYTGNDGMELYKFVTEKLFIELKINEESHPSILRQYDNFIKETEERILNNDLSSDLSNFKEMFKSRDGITITTAHKVKGNEYDTVIAINLLEGKIPHWNEIFNAPDEGTDSARKLLYVICSRAKNSLYLFSEKGYITNSGYSLVPTEILSEVKFEYDL